MTRQLATGLGACAIALVLTVPVDAGTIIGVADIAGGGNAVVDPILTGDPNNDNHSLPATSNFALIGKVFDATQPIDIVFDVEVDPNDPGTTEYRVFEGLTNSSGLGFIAFAFELGFGTGDDFVASSAGDGLDFDTPNLDPGPTSARFITTAHKEDVLRFSDGFIPNGMTDTYTLSIDIPDFDADLMPASATTDNGYRFTLRQRPTPIPEPGTICIVLLSALAWAVVTLRRRWG